MQAIALSLAFLNSWAAPVAAQPDIHSYRSVEVMALSGASLVGVPIKIQPPAPGGEQVLVCVVFRDWSSVSEEGEHYPEIGDFLSVERSTVEDWIKAKARILTFQGGSWLNMDDPKTKVFDANLNRIEGVDACISRLRQEFWAHPEIERIRPFYRLLSAAESRRMGVEEGAYLAVPYDQRVERWGIGCLKDKDWVRRAAGVDALSRFRSQENIRRLRGLLSDPHPEKRGDTTYFPVRERAARLLAAWGEK